MTSDEAFVERALRRIERISVILGAAGAVAAAAGWGWAAGTGFAAGAAASYVNFRWLKRMTAVLSGETREGRHSAVFFGLRLLILGLILYAIVKFFGVNPVAAVCGFLTVVGAVIIEILYELTYART
jgi:hypothetical protein